ncbi:MAG: FAD-dependent oxidoreductase [Chloroflexi bacterium]|nr:FAD-dependent oxidoreductase [Chloroflexota bacterium]MBI3732515.1 FAD-dependent oxidoreductase [Chloroflexota bacterium]
MPVGSTAIPRSVIVVGAGIFGVTAALELRRRGYRVSLFDPGPLPHAQAASTDISKVIRMDYGADDLYLSLMEKAFAGWDEWNRRWDEPPYHETGFLLLARRAMAPGSFEHDSYSLLTQHGHRPQRVNADTLQQRFPAWAAGCYADGYFNPRAGWAASGKVVRRLTDQAQAEGVVVREGLAFARLLEEGSRVAGVITRDGEQHRANNVVMAVGAWTPSLLPHLGDVMWATGQPVLYFRPDNYAEFQPPRFTVWAADIANTGWYGFPAMADGTLKIANHGPGRRVHPDEPRAVDAGTEAHFRAFLRESLTALAGAPLIASRLCLYCDTWDGNFWIDRDPDRLGLVVAAGDSGHGFKFAPVLGGLIADALERKPNAFAARFAWRPRGPLATEDARYHENGQGDVAWR